MSGIAELRCRFRRAEMTGVDRERGNVAGNGVGRLGRQYSGKGSSRRVAYAWSRVCGAMRQLAKWTGAMPESTVAARSGQAARVAIATARTQSFSWEDSLSPAGAGERTLGLHAQSEVRFLALASPAVGRDHEIMSTYRSESPVR